MTPGQIPFSVRATVWILAFFAIILEVSLTRVFAWVFQHHFAFFAVSLALCGLGLGGYFGGFLPGKLDERAQRAVSFWLAFAIPLSTLLAIAISLRRLVFHPHSHLVAGVLFGAPFLASGMILSLLFYRYASASGKLYSYDLCGAAVAAAASVYLLNLAGPINTLLVACLLASAVPFLLMLIGGHWTKRRAGWSCLLALGCATIGVLNWTKDFLDVPLRRDSLSPIRKRIQADMARAAGRSQDPTQVAVLTSSWLNWLFLTLALDDTAHVIHKTWNAFARNDVVKQDQVPHFLTIWADGSSPAYMWEFRGSYEGAPGKQELKQMLPYAPYTLRPLHSVLSIGAGAGLDVHFAKLGGAREVDAVEFNPAMKEIVDLFREFSGGVYDQPGVSYYETEGRSFVRQARRLYDHIVLALTLNETLSKGTLTESYITTLESGRDYLAHLTDRGVVSFFTPHRRHAQRWFLTCLEALKQEKSLPPSEALRHLALIEGSPSLIPYDYLVLMSNTRFTQEELDRLKSFAWDAKRGSYYGWTFIPERAIPQEVEALSQGKEWPLKRDPSSGERVNFAPATDNKPYFIHVSVEIPTQIIYLAVFALLLAAGFALLNRARFRRGEPKPSASWTGYFSSLGIGFMLVEVGLIQRFMVVIGTPTHAVALIILALLLGGAAGSHLSQRLRSGRPLGWAALSASFAACAGSFLIGVVSPWASSLLLGIPLWGRGVSLFLLSGVLGIFMGSLFPAGLRLLSLSRPQGVPYFWGLNGIMSVVGSVLAVVGGRFIGFQGVLWSGAAVYLLAGVFLGILMARRTFN